MIGQLAAFTLVSLAVIVIPGPDLVLLFRNAVLGGRTVAVYTAAGIMLGNAVLAAAAAIGVTALLVASQTLFNAVRIAGGLYLLYLGAKALITYSKLRHRHRQPTADATSSPSPTTTTGLRLIGFRQGLLSNLLNPKVAAFYLSLFPQFDLAPWSPALQHTVLAATFWTLALIWYIGVIIFLTRLRALFQSATFTRRTEAIAGTALLGLGGFILIHQA
ncbi:LysE family translocator [Mycobacteroides salmoniphilum]|uniref:Leucine efflux protein n=1 Tax=Mycobacteroides salmoniphilum TaxID=404941 RepID=A0A4R8SLI6_9MYCO|nr:LysE family translocator [Mycobacteroides salmoniphilum]TDZ98515.1 Leucine efflux protein [Mycobacteroides salmoniphilum]TEA03045.1 Leucine efflux protein [Mycobacteroides salmoniphilum]